jgi:hypothetical protein
MHRVQCLSENPDVQGKFDVPYTDVVGSYCSSLLCIFHFSLHASHVLPKRGDWQDGRFVGKAAPRADQPSGARAVEPPQPRWYLSLFYLSTSIHLALSLLTRVIRCVGL